MPTFEALGGLRYAAAYPYELAKHLRARTGPIRIAQLALARVDFPVTENDRADALKGYHPGRSVTVLNIQLAHYLGCNPIYLIGVDGHYRLSGEVEHRAPGEPYQVPEPELVETGLRACREYLEAEAVDLRNASRSTRVQALECVSLDELIG